jgi:hypothetical protein
VGGILLIAIVVVAAKGLKKDDGPQVLTPPVTDSSAPSGVTTIAPIATPAPDTAPVASTSAQPNEPSRPVTGGTGGGTPKPPVAATGAAACDACVSAASTGNINGAAANLQRCDDAAKKQKCVSIVKSSAPGAAKSAAFNGNCAGAKAIVAAATGMGATTRPLTDALKGTSCK